MQTKPHTLLLFLLVPTACIPEGPRPAPDADDTCVPGEAARDVLALRVQTLLIDALKVAEHAYEQEAAYSVSLAGSEVREEGYAFLVEPCTAPSEFDPYCEEGGGGISPGGGDPGGGSLSPSLVRCMRFACEDASIYITNVWYAADAARQAETEVHAIEYPTTVPPGVATHSPNPHLAWRAAVNGEDADVSIDVDAQVTIVPDDASGTINASHSGTATGTRRYDAVADHHDLASAIELTFPSLWDQGSLTVSASLDEAGEVTGEVLFESTPIGAIEGAFDFDRELPISWNECQG